VIVEIKANRFPRRVGGGAAAQYPAVRSGISGKVLLLLVLVSLILWCGCSPSTEMVVTDEFHPFTPEELAVRNQISQARYRLHPGDILSIDFKYQDELDREGILVLPDGRLAMAGADDILAAGLTVSELDSTLTEEFARDYRNPDLAVIVLEMGARQVYVFGEVKRPGAYPLNENYSGLLESIAMAGGFGEHASTSEVLIIRVADDGYHYRIADISHLEKRAPLGLAQFDIRGNDIIYVPRNSLGDLKSFSDSFLQATLRVTDIFWDIYAISHMEKVRTLVR
jgi:polysaccharide export outer membrane protein